MYEVPVAARAAKASVRTLDGPEPNRPSAGRRSGGIVIWGSLSFIGATIRRGWAGKRIRPRTATGRNREHAVRSVPSLAEDSAANFDIGRGHRPVGHADHRRQGPGAAGVGG